MGLPAEGRGDGGDPRLPSLSNPSPLLPCEQRDPHLILCPSPSLRLGEGQSLSGGAPLPHKGRLQFATARLRHHKRVALGCTLPPVAP